MQQFDMRDFLNLTGNVSVDSRVRIRKREGVDALSLDAHISFRGCTEEVMLDFDLFKSSTSKSRMAELRRKSAILRENVNGFCDALDKALDQMSDHLEGS